MGARSDSDIRTRVDQEPGLAGSEPDGLKNLPGERSKAGGWKILFAKLNEIDAIGGPAGGLLEQRAQLLLARHGPARRDW